MDQSKSDLRLKKYHEDNIKYYENQRKIAQENGDKKLENNAYWRLGEHYMSSGKYEEAISHFENSLEIAIDINDLQNVGNVYNRLGDAKKALDNYDDAIEYYKLAKKESKKIKERIHATRNLAKAYQSRREFNKAITNNKQCLKYAIGNKDQEMEGKVLEELGIAYQALERNNDAFKAYYDSLNIEDLDSEKRKARMHNYRGRLYQKIGNYNEAIECYKNGLKFVNQQTSEAVQFYEGLGAANQSLGKYVSAVNWYNKILKINKIIAYSSLGNVYRAQMKFKEALERYEKILEIDTTENENTEAKRLANEGLGSIAYLSGKHRTDNVESPSSVDQYKKAILYYEKSLRIAIELDDKMSKANTYANIGLAHHALGDHDNAIVNFRKELKLTREIGDKKAESRACANLGAACQLSGKFEETIKYYTMFLNLISGDRRKEASAYQNIGVACQRLGRYKKAFEYHEKHLKIAKEINASKGKTNDSWKVETIFNPYENYMNDDAMTYRMKSKKRPAARSEIVDAIDKKSEGIANHNLGIYHHTQGNYNDAIKFHERYLNLSIQIRDEEGMGSAFLHIANAYQEQKNYQLSIKYFEKYLKIAEKCKDNKVKVYETLGVAYKESEIYDKAIKCYENALRIHNEMGDAEGQKRTKYTLAVLYQLTGKYEEALSYFKSVLNAAEKAGDKKTQKELYEVLGVFYHYLEEFDKAEKECHSKSLQIATDERDVVAKSCACFNIGKCFQHSGNYDDALKSYNAYLKIAEESGKIKVKGHAHENLGIVNYLMKKYPEAKDHHEIQKEIAIQSGDKKSEGKALSCLGVVNHAQGNYKEAKEYFERHNDIAKEIADTQGEELALSNLADTFQSLKDYKTAIEYHKKCIAVQKIIIIKGESVVDRYEKLGIAYQSLAMDNGKFLLKYEERERKMRQVITNMKLGRLHKIPGKYKESIDYYKEALKIVKQIENSKKVKIEIYVCLGVSYRQCENYNMAIDQLKKCLETVGENDVVRGRAYSKLGSVYRTMGDYPKALDYYERYLDFAQINGDERATGHAHKKLGETKYSLGKTEEALTHHESHLVIATKLGDTKGKICANRNLGDVYSLLSREQSEYHFKEGLNIAKEIGDKNSIALSLCSLGEYNEAIKHYQEQLAIAKENDDIKNVKNAYLNLGRAHFSLEEYQEAIDNFEEFLRIPSQGTDKRILAQVLTNLGISYRRFGSRLQESEANLKLSANCWNEIIKNLRTEKEKISICESMTKTNKELVLTCIKLKKPLGALLHCDRGRARALVDGLASKYDNENGFVIKKKDLKDISVLLKNSVILVLAFLEEIDIAFWILTNRVPYLEHTISRFSDASEKRNLEGLIDKLVHTAYKQMDVRQAVTYEDISFVVFDLMNSNLETREETIQKKCGALKELFSVLIAPIRNKFIWQKEIVVVPEGSLYKVPFAALINPYTGNYLSETKRIRLIPSIGMLKIVKDSSCHTKKRALVIGNPEVGEVMYKGEVTHPDRRFILLKGAQNEAVSIGKIMMVRPFLRHEAKKVEIIKQLKTPFALIHIAAHGIEGGIILAPLRKGKEIPEEQDYILTMKEVQEIGIKAQLVVLSCCDSGRGDINAEGAVSMSRAFLAAGARAVVASLWAINDEATLIFMKKFYYHLKKKDSASASLQKAMKHLRLWEKGGKRPYREPQFWAPFFLIGDDVTIEK